MLNLWVVTAIALSFFSYCAESQSQIKLLVVVENLDDGVLKLLNDVIPAAEKAHESEKVSVDVKSVQVDRHNVEGSFQQVCAVLFDGITLVLDITYTGWDRLQALAHNNSILYLRTGGSIIPYVQAIDDLLLKKNATDVALIFENTRELNESLYYLIGNSIIRLVVIDDLSEVTVARIRLMRPSPSYYAIYSSTAKMESLFKTAMSGGLVKRHGIWNLVFTDMKYREFPYIAGPDTLNTMVGILSMNPSVCCRLIREYPCTCPHNFEIFPKFFERLIFLLVSTITQIQKSGIDVEPIKGQCITTDESPTIDPEKNATLWTFYTTLTTKIESDNDVFEFSKDRYLIRMRAEINLETLEGGNLEMLGNWTKKNGIVAAPGKDIQPAKRYFRVGTAEALPWTTKKKDPVTGEIMKDKDGKIIWEGYCIDFIQKLSEKMNFDYDLVIPEDNSFGHKLPSGKWNGLVGDLSRGETDIAIGALTMTSEREEVIDFVAPYFEQSGILIVMRKPVRETSLFKFMTVLRVEVWLSIVGALTLTAIMIWILDKYSPYSARNNKRIYPYPCREFTLKESFWFALTSFTPQGGGEAPKALSSRTLVAAYWLFVVLMLATFTANLAAFLTVERMQAQVQSLEQLARQSRINYTVVANSTTHQYFQNMKNAEDKLYNVWKEITLNSTSDQVEYRVWDYPIKEQYGHILQSINTVGPVKDSKEGFRKVIESEKAEFAFIHDSSEIKYEVTRSCNLTEIGEVFSEQPYAVAVQQGSHLQEEISRKILDLQKDRYFETLSATYWNASLKGTCSVADENEGITLESLGGVFIATLFGLALAMITLAGEVIYYRKRNAAEGIKSKEANGEHVRSGEDKLTKGRLGFKPAPTIAFIGKPHTGPRARISHISVYPKNFPFKE
ncbi:ionotropic receptor 25a [Diachasma alloeum]|uniref:Ionotropic receptor 8a n=1 Tax=Diachasma alloeum TaxID=454923 RepID=A0A4E0RM83_9HYME|nr:ionotropic receptor 25a [Diachasma alloeum]THK33259.1 ionotropic receptor 8a [Diachasma alloeum]